jgi:hypothetical protein
MEEKIAGVFFGVGAGGCIAFIPITLFSFKVST